MGQYSEIEKKAGKTIFLTTQYLKEADLLADEIGFLRDGEIVETGTPAQMKRLAGPDKLQLSLKLKLNSFKRLVTFPALIYKLLTTSR